MSAHPFVSRVITSLGLALAASIVALALAVGGAPGILVVPVAQAARVTYCVGPGSGDPASGCANPNHQDFTDINQALALAGDGDTINVASGIYPAITISQAVTITGG